MSIKCLKLLTTYWSQNQTTPTTTKLLQFTFRASDSGYKVEYVTITFFFIGNKKESTHDSVRNSLMMPESLAKLLTSKSKFDNFN
ncbi:hypothetical protein NC652_000215 [Populus alba x Populus x berolinensis]|nr:hypothetical protein NC652_000215 [Populus alba x Populus x berolinensis]